MRFSGPLAQLVERCIRIAEVSGSNPLWSTTLCSGSAGGEAEHRVVLPVASEKGGTICLYYSPELRVTYGHPSVRSEECPTPSVGRQTRQFHVKRL